MSYKRLDDRSISDVVLRSLFHQEVIKRSASFHEDNRDYTIRLDEIYRADAAPCVARCVEHAAFAENTRGEIRLFNGDGQITGALSAGGGKPGQGFPSVVSHCEVRRLTPKEYERLQGFPDCWTLIPEKKRNTLAADELAYLRLTHPDMPEEEAHRLAADGPRYKAIGNSMPVPVMRWIGDRIANQNMLLAGEIEPQPAALPAPPAAKKKRAPRAGLRTTNTPAHSLNGRVANTLYWMKSGRCFLPAIVSLSPSSAAARYLSTQALSATCWATLTRI